MWVLEQVLQLALDPLDVGETPDLDRSTSVSTRSPRDNLAPAEFLVRLLTDEIERREARQLELRLRRAGFEHGKTLETFDFHFNPAVPKAKIVDLATCIFIAQKHNVSFIGPTGVGKSHLAQAIGYRACLAGYEVLSISAQDLFRQLRAARADASVDRRLKKLAKPDLLIIDSCEVPSNV